VRVYAPFFSQAFILIANPFFPWFESDISPWKIQLFPAKVLSLECFNPHPLLFLLEGLPALHRRLG
jgi:hypothetical protein